jgi:hypothetical protein
VIILPKIKDGEDAAVPPLAQLTKTHADVLTAIDRLETLLQPEEPDRATLATARWRLTQASGRRRRLLDQEIYPLVEQGADGGEQGVRDLRAADGGAIAMSSQHIATWSIDHIADDWPGYRAAATTMLASMRQRIALETTILYPLLEEAPQ